MKKNKLILVFLLLVLFLTVGCTSNNNPPSEREQPRVFTDTLEREVSIPEIPEKVISLSPALTEILFALEVGDKVVGTTNYCDYPEEALNTPKVGDFSNPNYEIIVDSGADLVFIAAGVQANLVETFETLGLKVISIDAETVDQVLSNITLIGQIMDAEEKANEITDDIENRIQLVKEKVMGLEAPLVFFEVWDDPLTSAGPGTFINDLVQLAGGKNLAEDANTLYPQIDFEIVIDRDPDFYLAVSHKREVEIEDRPGYDSLRVVREGQVFTIEDDWVTMPGPRIILGLEEMARIIHGITID